MLPFIKIKFISSMLLIMVSGIIAQPGIIPAHSETLSISSGTHGISENERGTCSVAFTDTDTISVPDAPWLRLRFDDYCLGKKSYITITSIEDSGWLCVYKNLRMK